MIAVINCRAIVCPPLTTVHAGWVRPRWARAPAPKPRQARDGQTSPQPPRWSRSDAPAPPRTASHGGPEDPAISLFHNPGASIASTTNPLARSPKRAIGLPNQPTP